jgi:hypothetical protein
MGCRCKEEGKAKTIHFTRCGRWETRVYCQHTYKHQRLNARQTGHGRGRYDEQKIRRKQSGLPRRAYTLEQDRFILANYKPGHQHKHRGAHIMQKMTERFAELFGIQATPNMLIGRYHRLLHEHPDVVEQERPTPSLPRLKFMEEHNA